MRASDVHLTAGLPACRCACAAGSSRSTATERLTPQDTREIVYSLLNDAQRKQFENDLQLDFAYAIPSVAPLPRQLLLPARARSRPPSA